MRTTSIAAFLLGGVLGSLALAACDLDVPDLNNPGLDDLETNPTAISVSAATTGLLVGNRRNHAAGNGYVSQLGILGRESYNFDRADPRYVSEMLEGSLNAGGPFGGNFWAAPYANIRLANIVLHAVDKVKADELDDAGKAAIRGFTKTIQALDLLEVIVTHDTNGAVIDTDHDVDEPLPPIVGDTTVVFGKIAGLLEEAVPDLKAGGETFPFLLAEGYLGFDTPATFLTFNRAIRARVAVYMQDWAMALTALKESFLDDNSEGGIPFDRGVYYTYTTKSGDVTNGLINPNIFAHISIETDVGKNGANVDARFTRKITTKDADGVRGLSSSLGFTLYPRPSSSVPLIRNEELILLKAEALFHAGKPDGTGDPDAALAELNIVRQNSGGLPALVGTPDEPTFVTELLYERRYSLLFEGHRWIDVRRLGRMSTLPIEKTPDGKDHKLNIRYPIPLGECNARPGEAACALGSL